MSLLAEGIRSSFLPCSYSILLLGLALVILRRSERVPVLWVYAGFTILSAWVRASGLSQLPAGRAATVWLVLGGLGLALLVNHRLPGLVSAALFGVFAGATWFPCVGEELGALLTDAPDAPVRSVGLLAVYLVGVMIPIVAATAVLAFSPTVRRFADRPPVALAAGGLLAAVALLVVTDHYGALLSTLARWSAL